MKEDESKKQENAPSQSELNDVLSAKDIKLIKVHYDRCMSNAESMKGNPDCASNAHDQWLEEADSYRKILLILESR